MPSKVLASIFAACALCSCSYTDAVPITNENRDTATGFRVFGTKPLLLVSSRETKVIFVPNYAKEYAVRMGTFMAKNDSFVKISDAQVLQEVNVKLDSTTILSNFFNFANEAVKAGSQGVIGTLMSGNTPGEFMVFDIIFADDGSIKELKPLISPDTPFIKLSPSGGGGGSDGLPPPQSQVK